jgi:hypothetical protein
MERLLCCFDFDTPNEAGYSVSGAYHVVIHLISIELSTHYYLIWNMFILLKVSTFARRFIVDRLPTKAYLFARGCLRNESILCSAYLLNIFLGDILITKSQR